VEYIDDKLTCLNEEQHRLLEMLIRDVQTRVAAGRRGPGPIESRQNHTLVLGGPGVGKTFFVRKLQKSLEGMGSSAVTVAFTGAAACNIPGGRTIHSTFYIPITMKASDRLPALSEEQKQALRAAMEGKAFLLIDEVSMVGPSLIGMMHERLVQALENQQPFGGMSVIGLGDFYQLQPCSPPALFTSLMDMINGEGESGMNAYRHAGTLLFKSFKLFQLKTQMRAREDSEHGKWVEAFREGGNTKPITREFIELLQSRMLTADDAVQDSTWAWATIGVSSNMSQLGLHRAAR
jgi:hypothetical protein